MKLWLVLSHFFPGPGLRALVHWCDSWMTVVETVLILGSQFLTLFSPLSSELLSPHPWGQNKLWGCQKLHCFPQNIMKCQSSPLPSHSVWPQRSDVYLNWFIFTTQMMRLIYNYLFIMKWLQGYFLNVFFFHGSVSNLSFCIWHPFWSLKSNYI